VLRQSQPLDQVGVFARTVEDAALIAEQLMAFDDRDPDMRRVQRPDLVQAVVEEPPVSPRLAFVKTPVWDQADDDVREGLAYLVKQLGEHITEVDLPEIFDNAVAWHRTIMEADLARSFEREYALGRDRLSVTLREMIERGQKVLVGDYNRAVGQIPVLHRSLGDIFERYDALLTPATTGEAPLGLTSTGSPIFCTIWTLCGVPAISLPILQGSSGMPIGAQLVGAKGADACLLRTARWLTHLASN